MKKFYLIFLAAAALAMAACSSEQKPTTASEPLTDYSTVAPTPAPMQNGEYVCQRPAEGGRLFTSKAVEAEIERVTALLKNKRLAWMFSNCFPNTLDTTVHYREQNGKHDTFVYTGDIHAMWLRDSGAQVWPYVQYANDDEALKAMLAGVINRQFLSINIDPYANGKNVMACSWCLP